MRKKEVDRLLAHCRTRRSQKRRSSANRTSASRTRWRTSRARRSPCGATAGWLRSQSGKTSTQASALFAVLFSSFDGSVLLLYSENYTKLCTIDIDLSRVPLTPRTKINGGGSFYRLDYDIVLLFGLTELKAHIAWKENVRSSLLHAFIWRSTFCFVCG